MKFSRYAFLFLLMVAILAPFLANEKPLLVKDGEGIRFPVTESEFREWNQSILTGKLKNFIFIQPLIPWTAGKSDYANADFVAPNAVQYYFDTEGNKQPLPLRHHHFLGTDLRGADVLSGLMNALRITFLIGIVSTLVAALIAFMAGILAAWYAADGFPVSRPVLLAVCIGVSILFIALRNATYMPESIFGYALMLAVLGVLLLLLRKLQPSLFLKKILLPLDSLMTRLSEVFSTFPRFILVIVIGAFLRPSVIQVIFLLAITGWPDLARVLRAEILRLREQTFIDAGRASGAGNFRLLFRHLLPNAWPVLSVTLLYSLAMNILLEAGLGFLGMGIPDTHLSLGGMMAQGKDHLQAWWIILFPGLLLSLTLFCIYRVAESFRPAYDRE